MTIYLNGDKQTDYPNGRVDIIFSDGDKLTKYLDGRIGVIFSNGVKVIKYPDGKHVYELLDGSIKTTFPNERKELKK